MILTCYIVDDEYHSIEILKEYIGKTAGLELVGFSTNPLIALNEVASAHPPALTFLDVDMPELSGMEFAGLVNLYTTVIFTSAFPEFAIEAFEKEAFDYLLKPLSYERFLKSIQKAKRDALQKQPSIKENRDFFFVKTETKGKMVKISIDDILYVEGAQNYININLSSKRLTAYLTLTEIEFYLPKRQFSRIHQSFIINNEKIKSIEPGQVTLERDVKLTIGKTFKELFLERMSGFLVKTKRKL